MRIFWLLLSLFVCTPATALEVLGVVGPVVPAKPFYEKLLAKNPSVNKQVLKTKIRLRAEKWSGHYAYDAGLTSGKFESFELDSESTKRLSQALCLVANDERSKEWLTEYRAVLLDIRAVCYLVKSDSVKDIIELRKYSPSILFYELDPSIIITKFAVPFYPALISKRGVEQ